MTIYLIRHGESTSNVRFKVLVDSIIGFIRVKGFSLENFSEFLKSIQHLLLDYEPDSELSSLGICQVKLCMKLAIVSEQELLLGSRYRQIL